MDSDQVQRDRIKERVDKILDGHQRINYLEDLRRPGSCYGSNLMNFKARDLPRTHGYDKQSEEIREIILRIAMESEKRYNKNPA